MNVYIHIYGPGVGARWLCACVSVDVCVYTYTHTHTCIYYGVIFPRGWGFNDTTHCHGSISSRKVSLWSLSTLEREFLTLESLFATARRH